MDKNESKLLPLAEAGDVSAMLDLSDWYMERGDIEPFELWLLRANEAGSYEWAGELAAHYEKQGYEDKINSLFQAIETLEEHLPVSLAAESLDRAGFSEKAAQFFEQAFHLSGDPIDQFDYAESLSEIHSKLGNTEDAAYWRSFVTGEPLEIEDGVFFDARSSEIVIEIDPDDSATQESFRPLLEQAQREKEAKRAQERTWEEFRELIEIEHGVPSALLSHGEKFLESEPERGIALMTRAAEAGNVYAMLKLGIRAKGEGLFEDAERWWAMAHEAGHVRGSINTANMHESRGEVDRAREWLVKGAEAGHEQAIKDLIAFAERHDDAPLAEQWTLELKRQKTEESRSQQELQTALEKGAGEGDPEALIQLAGLHKNTLGNPKKAETLFRKAADLGHTGAMIALGVTADFDHEDRDAANEWYRMAAEAGSDHGARNLGVNLLADGSTVEGLKWLSVAAERGSRMAMDDLAKHHFHAGDFDAARTWLEKRCADSN